MSGVNCRVEERRRTPSANRRGISAGFVGGDVFPVEIGGTGRHEARIVATRCLSRLQQPLTPSYNQPLRPVGEETMYERILVALDGSELSERVLPHVEALAEKFGSTLVLIRVNAPSSSPSAAASPPQDPALVHRLEQQAAASHLARVADELGAKGFTVEVEMPVGRPARQITDYARTPGVDLIAMTTHSRSGLGRLVLGSVAAEVLQHAPCPVLLVRRDESIARQAKLENVLF